MGGDLLKPLPVGVLRGGHQEAHVAFVDQGMSDLRAGSVGLEGSPHEALQGESSPPGDAPYVESEISVGFVWEGGHGVEILLMVGFDHTVDEHTEVVLLWGNPLRAIAYVGPLLHQWRTTK